MELSLLTLSAFGLVLARTTAWVMTAPLMPATGVGAGAMLRLGLALALSLFLAPLEVGRMQAPTEVLPYGITVVGQVAIGLLLGWATAILLRAFEAAGSMIDLSSGFALSTVFDPVSGNNASVFGRFANLLFMALMFASNAHLLLVEGFVRSYSAVPAGAFPNLLDADLTGAIVGGVSGLMLAAMEIGAPILGVLFITEAVLALAARLAPQANVFLVGLPLKIMVGLFAMGTSLVYLPSYVTPLVERGIRLGAQVVL